MAKTAEEVMKTSKQAALRDLVKNLNKSKGAGTVMLMEGNVPTVETFPTGSLKLDEILGGGLPVGRIVELYGPESSGKTTLALMAVASAQKMGKTCLYVDVEQSLDPSWARKLGVDFNSNNLIFSQPASGEDAGDIITKCIDSGLVELVVLDSVAAMTPQAELDGEMGDQGMGLQARLMSKVIRKITAAANRNKCTVIMINQLREKIGVMFGNPETTPGGRALKFYASIRIEVRRKESIKDGPNVIGHKMKVKTVKNKVVPPYQEAELSLIYADGFDKEGELLSMATDADLIEKSGAWYSYKGERCGQGENNMRTWLKDNPAITDEIYGKLEELKKTKKAPDGKPDVDDEADAPDEDPDPETAEA
jgi:recombination protein RecA